MEIIKKDSAFFNQLNIIDYSLLVGVHNRSEHPKDFANNTANVNTNFNQSQMSEPQGLDKEKKLWNDAESYTTFNDNTQVFYRNQHGGIMS